MCWCLYLAPHSLRSYYLQFTRGVRLGNLSKNLSRSEFSCRCGCGFDTVDIKLVEMLQSACDHFAAEYNTKVMIDITGPNRCRSHNVFVTKNISSDSQHIYGRAADHKIYTYTCDEWMQVPPGVVFNYYGDHYPSCGRGLYINRVHLDSRTNGPAIWDKTK